MVHKPVKEEHFFRSRDGTALRSLKDLLSYLDRVDDHTYRHHVTHDKNDFALWVAHVLCLDNLSKEMFETKNKKEMMALIKQYMNALDKPKDKKEEKKESKKKTLGEKILHTLKIDEPQVLKKEEKKVESSHIDKIFEDMEEKKEKPPKKTDKALEKHFPLTYSKLFSAYRSWHWSLEPFVIGLILGLLAMWFYCWLFW